MKLPVLRGRYSKVFFKSLTQMKFIAEAIVDGSLPQLGIGLGQEKLANHLQFGFHLEGGKGFSAVSMKTII